MKRVMLVLVGGALAGVVVGFLFGPGADAEGPAARLRTLAAGARRTLDAGRQRLRRGRAAPATAGPPAPTPPAEARRLPLLSDAQEAVRGGWAALQARWHEAVAEGRRAAAETQRDLRRRYEELTGRS